MNASFGTNQRLPQSPRNPDAPVEQVRVLYGSAAILLVNLVTAPIAAGVLWQVYPAWILLGWIGLIFTTVLARVAVWRRFQRQGSNVVGAARWRRRFTLGAVATGCLWGLLGSVIFQTANPTYYAFVAFVLGGMASGAAMRDSAYLPAFYGFAAPAILPMIAALLLKNGFALDGMELLLAAFGAVLVLMGRDNNRRINENIRLGIEQATSNEQLQRVTSDLRKEVVVHQQSVIALKESNQHVQFANAIFAAQLEGSPSGILVADQDRKVVLFNRRFGEMWRIPDHVVAAGSDEVVLQAGTLQLRDPQGFYARVIWLYDHRDEVGSEEIDFKDGRIFDRYSGPLYDVNQKYLGRLWLFTDITARKEAEEEIRQLNEQMTANVESLQRHAREMTSISKLSDILQSCRSTAEAYPIIAVTAGNLFGEINGALSVVATGTHELETVVQWGADQTVLPVFYFDDCWALRTGQIYEVNGPGGSTVCRHFKSPPRGSYVCLPLMVQGETSGLLHLNIASNGHIGQESHQLMLTFGDVVNLSLANLRLRENLSDQAMRDQLTTLFNRRYLTETLPREIQRAKRDKTPLSVAMLDIDHFKQFNDVYGHDAGDVVLKELGAFLRGAVRLGDIACRYGGEELLLVLPECAIDEAQTRLAQICLDIKGRTLVFRGQVLPSVTLSVGLAEIGDDLASPGALITAADAALYAAKHNGRDRIEIFAPGITKAVPKAAA